MEQILDLIKQPYRKKYAEKYPDIIKTIFNNPNLGIIKNYFNVIIK